MSNDINIKFTAQDKEVLESFRKTNDAAKALGTATEAAGKKSSDSFHDLRRAANAAATEVRNMEKDAANLTKAAMSPLERYSAGVQRLQDLYQSGLLTQKSYQHGLNDLKKTMAEETGETSRLAQAEAEHNAQMQRGQAITNSLMTAEERRNAALREAVALRKSGHLTPETFGRQVTSINERYANDSGMTARENEALAARNRLEQEAIRLNDKHATSQQQLASRLKDLDKLKATGVLSQRAYNRETVEAIRLQNEGAKGANAWRDGMSLITPVVATLGAGLYAALQSEMQLVENARSVTVELDKQARRYAVLENLKNPQGISEKVLDVSYKNAVPAMVVHQLNQQLSSAGFENPLESGATDVAAKAAAAGSLDVSQVARYAEGASMFMEAYGLDKNAVNLLDVSKRMSALGNKTQARMEDIGEFGSEAVTMQQAGIPLNTTLSTMALLRQTRGAGESATGARNVVSFLRTMKGKSAEEKALKELGLKPEQVDLAGESLQDALKLLDSRISTKSKDRQGIIMDALFGRQNASAAATLVRDWRKIDELNVMQNNDEVFQNAVRTNQSGGAASETRMQVLQQIDAQKQARQLMEDKMASDAMKLQAERELAENRRQTEEASKQWADQGKPMFTSGKGVLGHMLDGAIVSGGIHTRRFMGRLGETLGMSASAMADDETRRIMKETGESKFDLRELETTLKNAVKEGAKEAMDEQNRAGQPPQKVEVVNQPRQNNAARPPAPIPSTRLGR